MYLGELHTVGYCHEGHVPSENVKRQSQSRESKVSTRVNYL